MNDETSATPLTDYALKRLRALATGNGIEPERIVFTATEEKTYTFQGITRLEPLCEMKPQHYGGGVRGKDRKISPNFEALRAEAEKRKQSFMGQPNWIEEAKAELRKEPGEGWGLEGARVELHTHSVVLAATENCKTCQGRKIVTCTKCFGRRYETCIQCHGQKQEFCYNCNGTGHNPQVPDQPCVICHGHRYISCRLCHGKGETPCPLCHARGNTPCITCKGVGQMTEEIHLTCGAVTHFELKSEGLPSALRRGLDRLGIANLFKGHAVIRFVDAPASQKDKNEEVIPGGLYGVVPSILRNTTPSETYEEDDYGASSNSNEPKVPEPILYYEAQMPFADLRVDFGGKKAAIGLFGLRKVFVDVPPFLDTALAPWIEKLEKAARGHTSPDEALQARALREALGLNLQGKGNVKELRKLYPVGLSPAAAEGILRHTKRVTKRITLRTRAIAAAVGEVVSAGIFAACFFTALSAQFLQIPKWGNYALDFAPLAVASGLAWAILNGATHYDLRKRFPETKTALRQTTGKTALVMLAAIILIWIVMLAFSPVKPLWLPAVHL